MSTTLLLHATLPHSVANGPGQRFTVWTQGCSLGCPGCFNPHTHPGDAGGAQRWPVDDLVAAVLAETGHIEGVTLTGGEPLEQPEPVGEFCAEIKNRTELGIVILSGFTRAEIEADPKRHAAVEHADMVVAGRYNPRLHIGNGLRGSSNKTYWARTSRYCPQDFADVPELEITLAPDGTMTVSGMSSPDGGLA